MKTIVHVLPYMAKGGTEKHVLTLLRGLHDKYKTILLAPRGEILSEFLKFNITFIEFPEIRGNFVKKINMYKERLAEIDAEYGVDLVHVHAAHEFVRFSRRVLPYTPIIFHLSAHQGSEISKAFNYWQSARISKKHADLLIAVSEEEKRIVTQKGYPEERVRIVYNGYERSEGDDLKRMAEIKRKYGIDGCLVIGNLGRLNRTKRLDVLIHAFGMLKTRREEHLKLLLIGDGPDKGRLESIVHNEGLEGDVHFPGFIHRGDRVLSVFDIFVLPTTFEGCSNVLVEVMAKGIPIVSTDIPSVSWMFESGKSALLFRKNSVDDLCNQLERLVQDRGLRTTLGKNALQRFRADFEAQKMIQKTEEIYKDLLK